jgi:hypothetical protein
MDYTSAIRANREPPLGLDFFAHERHSQFARWLILLSLGPYLWS